MHRGRLHVGGGGLLVAEGFFPGVWYLLMGPGIPFPAPADPTVPSEAAVQSGFLCSGRSCGCATAEDGRFHGLVQVPVYQRVNLIQTVSDYNLLFGATYRFSAGSQKRASAIMPSK